MYENIPNIIIEYFWKNTEKTNYCWNWKGTYSSEGLPILPSSEPDGKYKIYSSRRISLSIHDRAPGKSEYVHPLVCKNKHCVNPDHLVYGNEARFWAKVQKLPEIDGGCWAWIGGHDKNMYGQFYTVENGKKLTYKAHVYSWHLFMGRKPAKGYWELFVCHKCDHPWCVNPAHLFPGTAKDNADDMVSKNRRSRGEDRPLAKLTDEKVKDIRSKWKIGNYSCQELAMEYGVTKATIEAVINGKTWKHIV